MRPRLGDGLAPTRFAAVFGVIGVAVAAMVPAASATPATAGTPIKWRVGVSVHDEIVVDAHNVYVGGEPSRTAYRLLAFDRSTGQRRWVANVNDVNAVPDVLRVSDGVVIVTAENSDSRGVTVLLDARDGHRFATLPGGRCSEASGNALVTFDNVRSGNGYRTVFRAFDLATGHRLWQHEASEVEECVSAGPYFAAQGYAPGTTVWSIRTGERVLSVPDSVWIYALRADGRAVVCTPKLGAEAFDIGHAGMVWHRPWPCDNDDGVSTGPTMLHELPPWRFVSTTTGQVVAHFPDSVFAPHPVRFELYRFYQDQIEASWSPNNNCHFVTRIAGIHGVAPLVGGQMTALRDAGGVVVYGSACGRPRALTEYAISGRARWTISDFKPVRALNSDAAVNDNHIANLYYVTSGGKLVDRAVP